MVMRIALILALLLATSPALAADLATPHSAEARSVSSTTISLLSPSADFSPNHPVEDFFVVSLVSLPFVTLWTFAGAAAVAGISQQKFPPEFSDATLLSTAAVALGASFSLGLVSVFWGRGKAPRSTKPSLSPDKK